MSVQSRRPLNTDKATCTVFKFLKIHKNTPESSTYYVNLVLQVKSFVEMVFLVHALKSGCTAYSISMHSYTLPCGYFHSMNSIYPYRVGSMYTVLNKFSMHTHMAYEYTGSV